MAISTDRLVLSDERAARPEEVAPHADQGHLCPRQLFPGGNMSRRRGLLAAVRDRMRRQAAAREAEESGPTAPRRRPAAAPPPDVELEQLEAEARYHRDRFDLYRARVISGSASSTSAARLRELERTATAATERLAHARRARRPGSG
jgi:hypothetical protein